ncbi:response regulator transcription factor [bacterium]|nr:response regulator transcription factor [bacterium]
MAYLPDSDSEDVLGTILVVDDEAAIRNLLLNWLEPSGFKVEVASNGVEALEKATAIHPDAVIMDASMPVMGGFETLAEFKRRPNLLNIPIMMLTVHSEVRDIISALDLGAADYMQKPFNPQVLMARLRAIIRLRDSMHKLAMSALESPALLSVNRQGVILTANPKACDLAQNNALMGLHISTVFSWLQASPWITGEMCNLDYPSVRINPASTSAGHCRVSGFPAGYDSYALCIAVS